MGDQQQTKRPVLSLACDDPYLMLDIHVRLQKYVTEMGTDEELREYSRQLKKTTEFRRVIARNKRELAEKARQRRAEEEVSRQERHRCEKKLQKALWRSLLEEAVSIGLQPSQEWTVKTLSLLIHEQRVLLAQQAQRKMSQEAREVKLHREREMRKLANYEVEQDAWEHIPYVVRFGEFERGVSSGVTLGDGRSWNNAWTCHRNTFCVRTQKRLQKEHEARTGVSKLHCFGKGPHNPQKQPRKWKAEAGRTWRRKEHCESYWNHLSF